MVMERNKFFCGLRKNLYLCIRKLRQSFNITDNMRVGFFMSEGYCYILPSVPYVDYSCVASVVELWRV